MCRGSFETGGVIMKKKSPRQRKTTLKWTSNGELSAVDMARIVDRLTNPELTQCSLNEENKGKF